MTEVLDIKSLCLKNNKQNILNNISFSLENKHILGVLGTNGAGKSTLLKICANVLIPSAGTVKHYIKNTEIGYLPEQVPLIPDFSTYDYLKHTAELRNITNIDERINDVLDICQLKPVKNKLIRYLSKGNQQRVGLSQSILHKPKLLILDEPTSGLDPQQIANFRNMLLNLKEQCSIIFSTHIMQEVESVCDSAIVLNAGELIADVELVDKNLFKIIFSENIINTTANKIPNWIKGNGKIHFFANSSEAKTLTLAYCLLHQLDIDSVSNKTSELSVFFMQS